MARPVVRPATSPPHQARRRRTLRIVAFTGFGALLGVELVLVAPYLSRALSVLNRTQLPWLAFAVVAELASMGAFARVQRRMLAAGGARVPVYRMAALTYAANAVSMTLPGGTALSSGYTFRRLRSWGATVPAAGFTILASGVLSTLSFALLAVTCAVLAGSGGSSSLLVVAGVVVIAILTLIVRRHHRPDLLVRVATRALTRLNRALRREPETGRAAVQQFVADLSAVKASHRDWLTGLGFAGLNWVADLACLVACCQAVGATGSSLVLVMVAYVAGMSTSGVSFLPGGLGVVDAAMIFALTRGGVAPVAATAGVLLYRLVSFALVVAIGWLVWAANWFARRGGPLPSAGEPGPAKAQAREDPQPAGDPRKRSDELALV